MRSVLDQDWADMELIVGDNANVDETKDALASFASDKRLRVVTLEEPLPVTGSWNAVLKEARGEYVLLIGDDDALLPDYFQRVDAFLRGYGDPDCLSYNAYTYIAPDAIVGDPSSHYRDPTFTFGPEIGDDPLAPQLRRKMVQDMFRSLTFTFGIPTNLQMTLFRRSAIERLENGLFQPPFPDLYALGALLLRAETWAVARAKLVIVGSSRKSFWRFMYSDQHEQGLSYLGLDTDGNFPGRLPGNELLNTTVAWLLQLKSDYPRELGDIEVDRGAYLLRQVWAWYRQASVGQLTRQELASRLRRLGRHDWAQLAGSIVDRDNLAAGLKAARSHWIPGTPPVDNLRPVPGVETIAEFVEWVSSEPKGA
jgi:hypothetical protein